MARSPAILPDNCRSQRLAGLSIPQDGGFALIRDADGTKLAPSRVSLRRSWSSLTSAMP